MQVDVAILIIIYAYVTTLVVLWFLMKVRPKFPSGISIGIVVFLGIATTMAVVTILEFAIAPVGRPASRVISIARGLKIAAIEETMKLIVAALGILIAKNEAKWVDTKLSLAFVSGFTFGITEALFYVARNSYSLFGLVNLFLSRLIHPVFTVSLVGGILLFRYGKRIEGVLVASYSYLGHALLDHYLTACACYISSAVILLALASFAGAVYLLMPKIEAERKQRGEFEKEATVELKDHWLNKM
ncbi:hypothetical protein [Thermococcus sp. Bubb.Bath]|uniref:hypothetical protein n=1 Tax=Thermococcus sp. Bubb.Bath TaxID=1638242 RepID=UPI00143C073E|nr:hypothetical protein [Thermococcus sp. Bubb.Bath]NJF24808.1 hypothetical protein [Thermococcus sp. Bubb.Bath]